MASLRANQKGFLADYRVEETYLLRPDRAVGRAGIMRARDPQAREVLIKFWPRANVGLSWASAKGPPSGCGRRDLYPTHNMQNL